MKSRFGIILLMINIIILLGLAGCSQQVQTPQYQVILDRNLKIPADAVKMLPENDIAPPITLSSEYTQPVPVPGLVNSAGGEDSAFILPDGKTLYFFFTPDVSIPAELQITDGVTGIYVSHLVEGNWSEPERIILQDPGKLSLDGCEFVQNNIMYFCTIRENYSGMHWFTAEYLDNTWQNWQLADFNPDYQVGELHISSDGQQLYFASDRTDGVGSRDIWMSSWEGNQWGEPINVAAVNTVYADGWPALNPDGDELWVSRNNGLWRSKLENGSWTEAELMISPLAGEASIDKDGNVYFTHHFYKDDVMLEADIYVAYKIKQ